MNPRFYITTAIDYLNGQPHLGHAYEKVVTDVIARAGRGMGREVFFLTGLDEHGQKVQQAAIAEGKEPQAYCDELAASWRAFAAKLNLSNNDFIRTTDLRHKQVVQALLLKLSHDDRNLPEREKNIYKAEYRGFYSARQETFLTEKDRLPDGTFDPIYGEVVELVEENYYFRLSKYQGWLLEFLRQNRDFILPASRWNEIVGFLGQPLEDLCITRPKARLSWGITLPFDESFVTYVWFDALVNYITVPASLGDRTILDPLAPYLPPDFGKSNAAARLWENSEQAEVIHVIGKDIVKFHAVYWPIMLQAAGLPLPRKLLVHGWWQKDGEKMSKTTGNVVDPVAIIGEWGVDAFRYYVTRELDIGPDGNWTDAGFQARYHAELANGLGNLVNRSLSMLKRYRNGVVPERSEQNQAETSKRLQAEAFKAMTETETSLLAFNLQDALKSIWALVTQANQYVDQTAPFKLAKDAGKSAQLDEVLYDLAETCRILAVLLWPFLPDTSSKIYAQLGLGLDGGVDKLAHARWGRLAPGHKIGEPAPLFPRRDEPTPAGPDIS